MQNERKCNGTTFGKYTGECVMHPNVKQCQSPAQSVQSHNRKCAGHREHDPRIPERERCEKCERTTQRVVFGTSSHHIKRDLFSSKTEKSWEWSKTLLLFFLSWWLDVGSNQCLVCHSNQQTSLGTKAGKQFKYGFFGLAAPSQDWETTWLVISVSLVSNKFVVFTLQLSNYLTLSDLSLTTRRSVGSCHHTSRNKSTRISLHYKALER